MTKRILVMVSDAMRNQLTRIFSFVIPGLSFKHFCQINYWNDQIDEKIQIIVYDKILHSYMYK